MYSKINIGDLLYRSKGIVQHVGVYMGNERVLHNQPSKGVQISHYEEFADGKTVKLVKSNPWQRNLILSRLQEVRSSNSNYYLFGNNCEHTAHYIIYGLKHSPQLQTACYCTFLGAMISQQTENKNVIKGAVLGGLGGLLAYNILRSYDGYLPPSSS